GNNNRKKWRMNQFCPDQLKSTGVLGILLLDWRDFHQCARC
ncbi:hypothetical protein CEXT_569491, partial [Caerostris extrusa]